jgi:hypothetical protein
MSSWEDVGRIALSLPDSEEHISRHGRQWRVKRKLFAWERPLRPKEVAELGERAPDGPVLGVRVEHLGAKQALLEDDPDVYFTTSHFEGYAAILIRLDRIAPGELEEAIVEAWMARAPSRLVDALLAEHDG